MHTNFLTCMNNERIQQLTRFVQEEPDEPFNVYALAMEYMNDQPGRLAFISINCWPNIRIIYPLITMQQPCMLTWMSGSGQLNYMKRALCWLRRNKTQKTLQELERAQQAFEDDDDEW